MKSSRRFLFLGALLGGLAVMFGAFGAHSLRGHLSESMLEVFSTATRYQMYHALALLLIARIGSTGAGRLPAAGGWCFLAGIVLFSGSLYLLALTGVRWFGFITPFGGLSFIAGWGLLALHALRSGKA